MHIIFDRLSFWMLAISVSLIDAHVCMCLCFFSGVVYLCVCVYVRALIYPPMYMPVILYLYMCIYVLTYVHVCAC